MSAGATIAEVLKRLEDAEAYEWEDGARVNLASWEDGTAYRWLTVRPKDDGWALRFFDDDLQGDADEGVEVLLPFRSKAADCRPCGGTGNRGGWHDSTDDDAPCGKCAGTGNDPARPADDPVDVGFHVLGLLRRAGVRP